MRHREFLIIVFGAPTLSLHGMSKCPWRKGKRYSTKCQGVSPNPHTAAGDHGGNRPPGKVQKSKRIKTGPPGSPNGICIHSSNPGRCFCGKHNGGHR